MAYLAEVTLTLRVTGPDGYLFQKDRTSRWVPGTGGPGVVQEVTVAASTTTSLTVPSGAKALLVVMGSATGITIKGVTGDTGLPLKPASNPVGLDFFTEVSGVSTVVLLSSNSSSQTIQAIWL